MRLLEKKDYLELYKNMLISRKFDEKVTPIYNQTNEIPGSIHLSMGEEAVSVGGSYGLLEDDIVAPTLRTFGVFINRGVPVNKIMAEWFGKESGISNFQVS